MPALPCDRHDMPRETRISHAMRRYGMDRMQAYRHVQRLDYIAATLRSNPHAFDNRFLDCE